MTRTLRRRKRQDGAEGEFLDSEAHRPGARALRRAVDNQWIRSVLDSASRVLACAM